MKVIKYIDDGKFKYWMTLSPREYSLINHALAIAIDMGKDERRKPNMESILLTKPVRVDFNEEVKPIDY